MSWEMVKLGDVLDYEQPTNYIVKSDLYDNKFKTPVLTAGKSFILGYTDETDGIFSNLPVIIFDDFTTVSKYVDFQFKVKSSAMKILKAKEGIADTRYMFYLLQTLNLDCEQHKRYWISKFAPFQIPLPPLPIQKRIAEILDAADALKRKDQQLLLKYDELAQAVFIDMFGDPVKNEKGWECFPVINYCDCIVPGRDKPKSFSGDIPWVTTDDLNHLSTTKESKKSIGLSKSEIQLVKAKVIPENSVIMTCVGDLGIISINERKIVINQQLHAFQCGSKMNPSFLMYNLSYQKDFMYKMSSSTTVPYMNKTVCNSIPVVCPPIKLQNSFEDIINLIKEQKEKFTETKSNDLFQTLIQKAFKGELVN